MKNNTIRIGTRGSKLALYQAYTTKDTLEEKFPGLKVEVIIINSKGDKILDVALSKIGDKGLFTKELEEALLRDEVDIAVHSLKDVPTAVADGLKISAVLPRADVRDALVSHKGLKLNQLTSEMVIATSSLRRIAQLLKINPNFKIIDIRGNVDTRIRKMEEGFCDVMIMAAAGLKRLGLDKYISEEIDPIVMIPAVSQGAIAIESRSNDNECNTILNAISHEATMITTTAERIFLRKLEGGCQIPIGCYTTVENDTFTIKGYMSYTDGTDVIEKSMSGSIENANEIAENLAAFFIESGSVALLERIRQVNKS
ncbi:MAG: hydroxymethylbilane synthase [Bacteroidetes bacterium]|nr:hydroxymethylbilane synthase [Bacteroidota bacterium]